MITIRSSQQSINKVWGKQAIDKNKSYRLMTYIVRVESNGHIALANTVTGMIVVIEDDELFMINNLPAQYTEVMDSLILNHFLVPVEYEEPKQVANLRLVMRLLSSNKSNSINSYTILPTTACNARCYYCFEAGVKTATMTEEIASNVIRYIAESCGSKKKVRLDWFGGEPTVAANRITQICNGLRQLGINFTSVMTSNGYLFSEDMASLAANVWNLKYIQISVDGTDERYNNIKSYVHAVANPYQKVIGNVEKLTEAGINVTVRMNIDTGNYKDFEKLLLDLNSKIKNKELLVVYAFPILGEYPESDGVIHHGNDEWMDEKIVELNNLSRNMGLLKVKNEIPYLKFGGCSANNNAHIVIGPLGTLSRCKEAFEGKEIIGDLNNGITNRAYYDSWKLIQNYKKCDSCIFFPQCIKLANCNAKDRCIHYDRNYQYIVTIKTLLENFIKKENVKNDV